MMRLCLMCGEEVGDLIGHLEEIHTGPRPTDEIKINCNECEFTVSMDLVLNVINHCVKTNHTSKPRIDWRNFVKLEEKRVLELIRLGCNIMNGVTDNPATEFLKTEAKCNRRGNKLLDISDEFKIISQRGKENVEEVYEYLDRRRDKQIIFEKPPVITDEVIKSIVKSEIEPLEKENSEGRSISSEGDNGNEQARFNADKPWSSNGKLSTDETLRRKRGRKRIAQRIVQKKKKMEKDPKKFACLVCGGEVEKKNIQSQIQHVLVHPDLNLKLYFCNICGTSAHRRNLINGHCMRKHNNSSGYSVQKVTAEIKAQITQELVQSFPDVDWKEKLKDRMLGIGKRL